MPIEQKLIKADPADPRRCQGREGPGGNQCSFIAVEGQKYCLKHGGARGAAYAEQKRVSLYRLQQWQQRVDEFAAHPDALSLRDELGILRLQLESIHNQCESITDLMLYSSRISDVVMKIDKLTLSCVKIESRSAALLDKSAALVLAGQIVDIISSELSKLPIDDDLQGRAAEAISGGIIDLVAKLAGKEINDEE